MNANYATTAGSADSAKQASTANTAVNATYAQVAKQAEKLTLGGTMIYFDPNSHYIILTTEGMDPNKSIMIDPVNRNIFNVNAIADIQGNQICPAPQ
jgi:hypothetical protein